MRRAAILFLLLICSARADIKTGELDLTFTEHSPLSSPKNLNDRLGTKDATDDDDLASTHFLCYVPPDAGPAGNFGLVAWLNYRPADALPKSIEPVLDRTHTIFIVAKTTNPSTWARAALLLDAAFNLRQQYSIDEHRTFLISLPKADDTLGQQMGLAFPDAFGGFAYVMNFRYFRPITDAGQQYAASFAKPANTALFGQSKLRRQVLVGDLRMSETNRVVFKAYVQDGFANSARLETQVGAVSYPRLDPDFFGKLLDALSATPAVPAPVAAPASQPVVTEPPPPTETDAHRMLNLASNLAAAHQPDAARAKLKDLLARFPGDPSAVEARSLLDELEKQ